MPIFHHRPAADGLRRETTPEPTQLAILFLGGVIITGFLSSAYTFVKPQPSKHTVGQPVKPIPPPDPRSATYCILAAGATIYLTRAACRWVEGPIHPYGTDD